MSGGCSQDHQLFVTPAKAGAQRFRLTSCIPAICYFACKALRAPAEGESLSMHFILSFSSPLRRQGPSDLGVSYGIPAICCFGCRAFHPPAEGETLCTTQQQTHSRASRLKSLPQEHRAQGALLQETTRAARAARAARQAAGPVQGAGPLPSQGLRGIGDPASTRPSP
jgi:hypothetical protein